ncbi:MAG: hypothetical protein ACLP9D_04735 [Candidatus Bathyarchaeia archaeon]
MVNRQNSRSASLIVCLLLLSSTVAVIQLGIPSQSYGQYVTETTYPPGSPTTWHVHTGNWTWTHTGNQTWSWNHTGNRTFTRPGNLTWVHTGNQSWTWIHTANQTWTQLGNMTGRKKGGNLGLVNGWAHSNVTIAAGIENRTLLMNGTYGAELGFIAVKASSSGQIIRNVAYNGSVLQIEFDHNGSIQLNVNSSAKPAQVFADNNELTEAQSLNGLTPESEAWVYDSNSHTLAIFADPSTVTLVYNPTPAPSVPTPVPEYPTALALVLTGCLTITLLIEKKSRDRKTPPSSQRH